MALCLRNFNTSHVTVYQLCRCCIRRALQISIHLMLLFISTASVLSTFQYGFQYISCYCLSLWRCYFTGKYVISIHLMLLFIPSGTSSCGFFPRTFQYISCYCLSLGHFCYHIKQFQFQYISCYCLSRCLCKTVKESRISIHLMLLFIYNEYTKPSRCVLISIHLMLLFIFYARSARKSTRLFQYISCYCLS